MIKEGLSLKYIADIALQAIEPMSILQIRERFALSLPFRVKRVRYSKPSAEAVRAWEGVTTVSEIFPKRGKSSVEFATNNVCLEGPVKHRQSAELEDYILWEVP